MREFKIDMPGGRLVGEEDGAGPAVVLVHAGVADRRMWSHLVPVLATGHRVVLFDMRGYGASPPADQPFLPASDVVAVLDHLKIKRAHLVGASMGGYVTLDVAIAHPRRVMSLTLLASGLPGYDYGPQVRTYAEEESALLARGDLDAVIELNLDVWVRGVGRPWSPRLRAVADELRPSLRVIATNQAGGVDHEEAAQPLALDALTQVAARTLVVIGENDLPAMHGVAGLIAERVPGARLERLADAAHLPALERPAETLALLQPHLRAA